MLHDGYANAVKPRVLIFSKLLEFVVREIHRVGIESGEHPLNGRLRGSFVVYVTGVFVGDGADCFVVVLLDVVRLGIGNCGACRRATTKPSRATDRAANNSCDQNQRTGNDDKSFGHDFLTYTNRSDASSL